MTAEILVAKQDPFLIAKLQLDPSQEVVGCAACDVGFSTARGRVKHQEIVIHLLVHFHYARLVAASVAVVRRRENCHHLLLVRPVVALRKEAES